MLFLLALLACPDPADRFDDDDALADDVPPAEEAIEEAIEEAAPIPEVVIPDGQAVVRMECYGSRMDERHKRASGAGYGGPPPSAAPSSGAMARPSGGTASSSSGMARPSVAASAPAEPSMAPPPPPSPVSVAAEAEEAEPVGDDLAYDPAPRDRDAPAVDWGATVYLSNDDSMSLASAQRVLWAVKEGRRLTTSQIRPHELLNYFTFDTADVKRGDLFSAAAAATRTGEETLTVSLAVKGANPPRKPLDITVVVDRSGSMSAEGRMEYTKRGLGVMADQLQRGDRVDIVLFDDRVCTPLEDWVSGRDDPQVLRDVISRMQPRGSTDLDKGLEEGYRLATAREGGIHRNQRVMVMTDAFLNTGDVNPSTVTEIGRAYEDKGIRLTGVGVGREFNDKVLDMLTEKGKGAYVYLGSEAVVDRVFGVGFDSLTRTIAHDVHFALDLPDSMAMERFYGEEASTTKEDVQPINYYAGTSQLFLQDLRVDPDRIKPRDQISLTISYRDASTEEPEEQVLSWRVGDLIEADQHNLHKSRALMAWTDLLIAQSMRADPCGEPLRVYRERSALVTDDAEIGYVNSLVAKTCPSFVPGPIRTVTYKVKVDSDVPIAEVRLDCGGTPLSERLSASDTVARFETEPGECRLVLDGAVPMTVAVNVPETGGDVRCMVRGGRLSCD